MKLINGWHLPSDEKHLIKYLAKTGEYQKEHRDHTLKFVKEFNFAVDVGAHVGLWARDLKKKFHGLLAFEPVLEHRECLIKNVPGIAVLPFALGDFNGTVDIVKTPGSSGHTYCKEGSKISMATLDIFSLQKIDFIKIDVEGYEYKVLEGAAKTLLRDKPIVNIEQKNHKHIEDQYAGCKVLESLGAKFISRYDDEFVYGWE